jgi:hypothetical protein
MCSEWVGGVCVVHGTKRRDSVMRQIQFCWSRDVAHTEMEEVKKKGASGWVGGSLVVLWRWGLVG